MERKEELTRGGKTHVAFSDDYTRAIEQKQVAQQIAERQRFLVEKSRQEKEAEVILAEGETESAQADSWRR